MTGREVPDQYLEGYAQILAEACATRPPAHAGRTGVPAGAGESAPPRPGIGLRALVAAHLSATRATGRAHSPHGTDRVLAVVEQAVDAFAEGYERAQRLAVRQEEARTPGVHRRPALRPQRPGPPGRARRALRAAPLAGPMRSPSRRAVNRYEDMHPATRQVESAVIGRFGERQHPAHHEGRPAGLYRPRRPGRRPGVLRQAGTRGHRRRPGRHRPPPPGRRRSRPLLRRGPQRPRSGRPAGHRRSRCCAPPTSSSIRC